MREVMLVLHFIGLAMGLGTSFGFMFLGIASARMENTEAGKFRMNILALSKMGYIGIGLLIVSGMFLMGPYWKILSSSWLLIVKLVLVIILVLIVGIVGYIANNARKGKSVENLKFNEPLGKVALIVGVTIVILAVYIFH